MKITEIIEAQMAYGWSPEEIHFQHPYLSMSQIHSSLAYYWDYKVEVDADIERRFEYAERMRKQATTQPCILKELVDRPNFKTNHDSIQNSTHP